MLAAVWKLPALTRIVLWLHSFVLSGAIFLDYRAQRRRCVGTTRQSLRTTRTQAAGIVLVRVDKINPRDLSIYKPGVRLTLPSCS